MSGSHRSDTTVLATPLTGATDEGKQDSTLRFVWRSAKWERLQDRGHLTIYQPVYRTLHFRKADTILLVWLSV